MPSSAFRRDLYALRGVALLAIVAQYGSLPFFDSGWPVQDEQRSLWYFLPYIVGNGFLPQTFCLASGFFTARLWRRLGLKEMLRHRFRNLILPLLLAFATIVPLSNTFFMDAAESLANQDVADNPHCISPTADIWCATKNGNLAAIGKHLAAGVDIDAPDPKNGLTPLTWATVADRVEVARYLLKMGADIDGRNSDGGTALHEAATMGQGTVAEFLIRRGANIDATDNNGKTLLDRVHSGWKYLHVNIKKWQLTSDLRRSHWGWMSIAKLFIQHRDKNEITQASAENSKHIITSEDDYEESYVWHILTKKEILQHVGFLWVVCLLMPLFVLYAVIANRFKWKGGIGKLALSPYRYLWLIPLTMIPQWFMTSEGVIAGFGPDHSASILPPLRLIFYYGIFFFFGVLYYDCNDASGKLGKHWAVSSILALLVIFPIGMTISLLRFALPIPGFGLHLSEMQYLLAVAAQAAFTWVMIAVMIGLFRHVITQESKVLHYISDNSYWLFLFHPPLLIFIQSAIKTWMLPADIKYILTLIVMLGVMLLTYEILARYTPIEKLRDTCKH